MTVRTASSSLIPASCSCKCCTARQQHQVPQSFFSNPNQSPPWKSTPKLATHISCRGPCRPLRQIRHFFFPGLILGSFCPSLHRPLTCKHRLSCNSCGSELNISSAVIL